MPVREFIIDPAELDCDHVVAEIDEIRKYLPQRFAMEQLTAIIVDDVDRHICAGYKDLTDDEFWVAGHMPGMPIMPGVIMCEMAAQVLSYHIQRHDLSGADLVAFGGIDKVRFRGVVKPGDRLAMVIEITKHRRGRLCSCRFQGFVGGGLVCEGEVTGVALPNEAVQSNSAGS